jgi:hypothetical protein
MASAESKSNGNNLDAKFAKKSAKFRDVKLGDGGGDLGDEGFD